MHYDVISADYHIDLIWLPPDLFTSHASAALKDRMPYVTEGGRGREWVTKNGASFGLEAGMGSAGRKYEPGKIHRSDRMATTGLYDPEHGCGFNWSDTVVVGTKSGYRMSRVPYTKEWCWLKL